MKEPYESPQLVTHETLRDMTAGTSQQCAPWTYFGTREQWEAP